jgi:hypothetical protein
MRVCYFYTIRIILLALYTIDSKTIHTIISSLLYFTITILRRLRFLLLIIVGIFMVYFRSEERSSSRLG